MNIYDLIFMACLQLGQPATCKQQMLQCVLEKRDSELKAFMAQDHKKLSAEQFLNAQPQAKWDQWTLDCAFKQSMNLNNKGKK